MLETLHAHFQWTETTNSSDTVETFSASGTFTIVVDLGQRTAQGTGQGTLDDKVTGICTGESNTDYTFTVGGGVNSLTGNLTLGFGLADPGSGSTTLTCPSGTSNHTFGFLPVYPIQVTLADEYGTSVQGTSGNITYEITLA